MPRRRRRTRRAVTVALGVLVVVGVAVVATSVLLQVVFAPLFAGAREVPSDAATPEIAAPAVVAADGPIAQRVDATWVRDRAAQTRIPERALAAYAGASLAMSTESPGCRIGWTTLAAIGAIESDHGRHDGARIDDDGVTRPGVWGRDLDGDGTMLIADSDGGAIDGTADIDRAVGPMQFIPQTWASWGSDGNGDGIADPQQIDDAALAAARYLCRHGDLSVPATWRQAMFSYNNLDSYVDKVATRANRYGEATAG